MWGFMTLARLDLEGRRVRPDPADAWLWISVYDELIRTCRHVIGEGALPPQASERRAFWLGLLRE
jgi:hypothetical protein